MNKYLLVYSYVFINKTTDAVLLYNSISGKSIISNNTDFINMFKHINLHKDYIFPVNESLLTNKELNVIFEELENFCFAQIISGVVPLNFKPILDIDGYSPEIFEEDKNSLKLNDRKAIIFREVVGKDIITNFIELTIHFNCSSQNLSFLEKGHKQYPFPIFGNYEEINFELLKKFFKIDMPNLKRVNIIAGEINDNNYMRLNNLINLFCKSTDIFLYTLYDNYKNINDFIYENVTVYLWFLSNDLEKEVILNKKNLIGGATNQIEYKKYSHMPNFLLNYYPIYTGTNEIFCRKLMSFKKEDLLTLHLNEREIFSNKNINSNFYGEITITPNGNIYSCINKNPIGNISSNDLKNILLDEFNFHKNWLQTRRKNEKCKNCLYNFLCPPITNFEMCLNQVNLCNSVF